MTHTDSTPASILPLASLRLLDALLLALLAYLLVDRLDFSLLFQPTIMTGGDSASWYQIALYLKQDLLPHGRIMGWNQDNFLGYPEFQYYFIPPFLLAVLLSYLIPLTISLKIVSVLGILAMPFTVYWALNHIQYRRPVPMIGAWLSLIFLFHERYNMFGANALSTLAGEFSYSFAFLIQVIFMSTMIRGVPANKKLVTNALLLALIGLSHAFVFLTAALIPLYFWWQKDRCKDTALYAIKLYGLAFLLMAFWTLPMLAQIEYTTPVRMIWSFNSFEQLLSMLNYEILLAALAALVLALVLRYQSAQWQFYLYMILVSALLYLIASALKIPDIRFFPPLLFFSLMLIIDSSNSLLAKLDNATIPSLALLVLALLTGGSWLYHQNNNASAWWSWNFSGFETKPAFRDGSMTTLIDLLKTDDIAPRVAWEKSDYNPNFGSDRVFESLPLFTGRNTLEGIHYSAALLSKPLTWLLGEYSLTAASPEALVYAHYNLDILPARFKMFNISEIIIRSPEMKSLFRESSAFSHLGDAGELSVFKLSGDTGDYVSTPTYQPQLADLTNKDWKARYYTWFQHEENLNNPLVSRHFVDDYNLHLFSDTLISIGNRGRISNTLDTPVPPANIKMKVLDGFEISFQTDSPGQPHIIKVAYSPNWTADNGEIIFPISPGLMLIYPQAGNVTLHYGRSNAEYLGLLLSFAGMIFIFIAVLRRVRGQPSWRWKPLITLASVLCRYRLPLTAILIVTTAAAATHAYQIKKKIKGDYQTGIQLRGNGQNNDAEQAFLRASSDARIEAFPQNPDIPHAITALAWLYSEQNRDEAAMAQYQRLVELYPYWTFIHQTHDGIAQLHERNGRVAEAAAAFGRCAEIDRFTGVGIRCHNKHQQLSKQLPVGSTE